MGKHIVIYDAVNAGVDWSEDIVRRCMGEDSKTFNAQATIVGKIGTKLTMNKEIAEMISHNLVDMIVTNTDGDISVFIGNYVHAGFKAGIFPNDSEIHVVTNSDAVVAAVKMAVILAAEYLKGHVTFVIDRVRLQNGTNLVCYSKPQVILGTIDGAD